MDHTVLVSPLRTVTQDTSGHHLLYSITRSVSMFDSLQDKTQHLCQSMIATGIVRVKSQV